MGYKSAKPPQGVFNVSSLFTREGSDGSSNALRRWIGMRISEFVTREPSKLTKFIKPLPTL
jgi:hypothetical protein